MSATNATRARLPVELKDKLTCSFRAGEAATDIADRTLRELARRGEIETIRFGEGLRRKRTKIVVSSLLDFIERHRTGRKTA